MVGCIHAARETVDRIVRNFDCVLFVVIWNERKNGSKNFLARDCHVVIDVGEERRLYIPALREFLGSPASSDQTSAFGLALFDIAKNALTLELGNLWSHHHVHALRVTVREGLERRFENFDRALVMLTRDKRAGLHRTTLATVHTRTESKHRQELLNVYIVHDHCGGFAAQFQEHALEGWRTEFHDAFANSG